MLYERRGENPVVLFRSVKDFRLHRPVDFGVRVDLEAAVVRVRGRFGEVRTAASAGGEPVAEALLGFAVMR